VASYEEWTAALGAYFFPRVQPGRVVALAVDPEVLRQIAQEHQFFATSPADTEAVADFARAVAEDVAVRGWAPAPPAPGIYPPALARCSLFALAFSLTHRNAGEMGRPAFWREVWALLLGATPDAPESNAMLAGLPGPDPFRLTGPVFQHLWREGLAAWANDLEGGRWGRVELPEERSGPSCHLRLVQSQAGLRQLDLDRSGDLFEAAGLQPGQTLTEGELWSRVQPYFGQPDLLLPPARAVVNDPSRLNVARVQLAVAFEAWEGEDLRNRGAHSVRRLRIWMQVDDGRLRGGLVERRANGSDHPCEQPLGDLLASSSGDLRIGYQRRGEVLLAVFDTFDQLYVEQPRATPGDRILLLVPQALAADAEDWCRVVGEEPRHRADLAEVPVGWEVFSLQVREVVQPAVYEGRFGKLLARQEVVRLVGGLRLGRRDQWMAGAGPTLEVLEPLDRTAIEIDGEQVENRNGVVTAVEAPKLNEVGWHRISVNGREVRSFSVVEPTRTTVAATAAWVQTDPAAWPTSRSQESGSEANLTIDGPCVRVPRVVVDVGVDEPSVRIWLTEAVALARKTPAFDSAPEVAHSLVRQLREARRALPRSYR
jgi:hypothetical protein